MCGAAELCCIDESKKALSVQVMTELFLLTPVGWDGNSSVRQARVFVLVLFSFRIKKLPMASFCLRYEIVTSLLGLQMSAVLVRG